MAGLIYLAQPYSAPAEYSATEATALRGARFHWAKRLTERELLKGNAIFSPIVYGCPMEQMIGTNFEVWAQLNDTMIRKADQFWLFTLIGWEASRGVAHELALWFGLKGRDAIVTLINDLGEKRDVDFGYFDTGVYSIKPLGL